MKWTKRKKLLLGLLVLILAGSIVPVLSLFNSYSCSNTAGIHYCSLGDSRPQFLERMFGVFDEGTQVAWGARLLSLRSNLISNAEAIKASDLAGSVYTDMRQDPAWSLPSSLGIVYEDVLDFGLAPQQYFVYKPQGEVQSVIVFLHGLGGNFKSYLYLLSQVAAQTGSVVIAPSYQRGNWYSDSPEFIDSVISDATQKFQLENLDKHLVAISNGGLVLPMYLLETSNRYKTVVALSTYLDSAVYANPRLHTRLKHAKFFYIFGEQDNRIGLVDSLTAVRNLKQGNVQVETLPLEGDHFLFFEQRNKLIEYFVTATNKQQ